MGTMLDEALRRLSDDPVASQLLLSLSESDVDADDHMLWLLGRAGIHLVDFSKLSLEDRYAALRSAVVQLLSQDDADDSDDAEDYAVDSTDGTKYRKDLVAQRIEKIQVADPVSLRAKTVVVFLKGLTPQEKHPVIEAISERIRSAGLRVPEFLLNL